MFKKSVLLLILILGGFLRLVALNQFPVSLSVDEVAIGYDAFSLLNIGRDHHGQAFPLVFKSLGDFKSPLYIYLTTLPVRLFGLNEFSVRFSSAIFGVISIALVYVITFHLTKSPQTALAAAFVMSVSPWSLRLSRAAYEANVALVFSLLVYIFFLKRKLSSAILFALLSLHTYHSPKLFLFLLVPGLFAECRPKITAISVLLFSLILATLFLPGSFSRALPTNISRNPEIQLALTRFTGNKQLASFFLTSQSILTHYLEYFDPSFLFTKGLNLTLFSYFDHGVLYWPEAILLLLGLVLFFRRPQKSLLLWTLLAPLPAAVTLNNYHFIRSLPLILPLTILIALGITKIPKKILPLLYLPALFLLIDLYLVHFPIQKSEESFEPSKQIALYALSHAKNYSQVVIDPLFGKSAPNIIGAPEIYLLFYGQIDPRVYWTTKHSAGFANFHFRYIEYFNQDELLPNALLIGSTWSLPPEKIPLDRILTTFYFKNLQPAYFAIPTSKK